MKQENKIVGLYPLTKFYLAIVLVVLDIIMPGILSKLVVFVIINIIAALKFGVMLPLTVYLANELKKHGVRMKDNIITSDEMADQLQKIGKKE